MHSAIGTIDRLYTRDDPPKLTLSGTTDPSMKLVDKYFQIMDKYDESVANPSGWWRGKGTVTQRGDDRGGVVLWTGPQGWEKAKKEAEKTRKDRMMVPVNRPTKTYIGLNLYLHSYTGAGLVHMT